MPWELFCINSEMKNSIFITVNSSAIGTYDFTVNNNNDNGNIFIYTYSLGNFNENIYDEECETVYSKYSKYKRNILIPKNLEEFKNILIKIKGEKTCSITKQY